MDEVDFRPLFDLLKSGNKARKKLNWRPGAPIGEHLLNQAPGAQGSNISARGLLAHERVWHSASPPSFLTSHLVLHLTHSPHLTSSLIFLQFIYINLHDIRWFWEAGARGAYGPKRGHFLNRFVIPFFNAFGQFRGPFWDPFSLQNLSRGITFPTALSIPLLISFRSTFGSYFGCVLAHVLTSFFIFSAKVQKP